MGDDTGLRGGEVLRNALLVGGVPVLLAAIHLLVPPAIQEQYVLTPDSPTSITLFTAAFLHLGDPHLAANVVGYLLGALSAYLLCLLLAERRWFWLSTLALVLGLPILVNWTSLQVLRFQFGTVSAPMRGYSGVAAGFGGFAFAALLAFVGRATDRWSAFFSGLAVVLVLLWEVLVIYSAGLPLAATALVAIGVVLCLGNVARRWNRRGVPPNRRGWLRLGGGMLLFLWTVVVLAVLVAGLFPATVVENGQFTNVFAHAIGFVYGLVVTGWGYRYWRTTHP